MSYATLKAHLASGGTALLDGATGTELQRRGVTMEPTAWCGTAALSNTDILQQVHADYIEAGSRIITSNTFATSRMLLARAGLADRFEEINRATIRAALAARDASGKDVVVAGSLSHMIPRADLHGPTDPAEVSVAYAELAQFLAAEGCELILLEMMFRPERMIPAFEAAWSTGLPIWAGFSARRGPDGAVLSFARDEDIPFSEIVQILRDFDVDAAGVMHSEAEVTGDALALVRREFDGPLAAYPDSGHMKMPNWQFVEVISPEDLVTFARGWREQGCQIFGGCCGLGADHIRALGAVVETGRLSETA